MKMGILCTLMALKQMAGNFHARPSCFWICPVLSFAALRPRETFFLVNNVNGRDAMLQSDSTRRYSDVTSLLLR